MVGSHHSETLKIRAKMCRYGRWGVGKNAKTTDFPGGDALAQKRGSGTSGRKMRFSREKHDRYGFTPLKRPGFLLKRSQTMGKTSGTPRIRSQTIHKATIASPEPPDLTR